MKGRAKKEIEKLNSLKLDMKTEKGEQMEIPEAGSLGLLALGAAGLMAWRNVRGEIEAPEKKSPEKPPEKSLEKPPDKSPEKPVAKKDASSDES